jgi:hypothetical protein
MKTLIDFLSSVLELLKIQATEGSSDAEYPESDNPKDAYAWLLEQMKDPRNTRVQIDRDPWMKPGKIYIFKYDAKYKNLLEYWDKHPIVFVLGKMQTNQSIVTLGLNLSWYPPNIRKQIIERIQTLYKVKYGEAIDKNPYSAKDQKSVLIDLYTLKMALDSLGLSWAIRSYLPEKIKNPKYCICYEDWDKAIRLDQPKIFPDIQGSSIREVYEKFKKYVQYQRSNQAEIRKRTNEAKKLNKYRFIK